MKRKITSKNRSVYKLGFVTAVAAAFTGIGSAYAGNSLAVFTSGSAMDTAADWSPIPTTTNPITAPTTDFLFNSTFPTSISQQNFTLSSNTSFGSLDSTSGYQINISGGTPVTSSTTYSLTLGGGSNAFAPSPNDLIYTASGTAIDFRANSSTASIVQVNLSQSGNFDTIGTVYMYPQVFSTGTLTKTGSGFLELLNATSNGTNISGGVIINAGTLYIGSGSALGYSPASAATPELSFSGNSTLEVYSTAGFGASRTFNIASGVTGTIYSAGSIFQISSSIIGPGSLNIAGTGRVVLNGTANAYQGSTTITSGTLGLNTSSSILSTSPLIFAGGTLFTYPGYNGSQAFASTNISSGLSAIVTSTLNKSSQSLALGGITRSVGTTLDITIPTVGSVTTTTANANFAGGSQTILGGYATANNQSTWAVSSGTGTTPGAISALNSYDTSFNVSGANLDVVSPDGGTTLNITSGTGVTSVNSIRFNTSQALTLTVPTNFAVATGGILVTPNVGGSASTITGGSITSNNGQDLIVIQNNNASTFTIASNIVDSILGSIGLTKAGIGSLTLTGTNTLTGLTNIYSGNIILGSQGALSNSTVNTSGGTILFAPGVENFVIGGISGPSFAAGDTINLVDTSNNPINSLTFGGNNQNTTFDNLFNGSGPTILVKMGTGTTYLADGNSTYSGSMNITSGTINFVSGASFGNANNTVTIFNGASILYNGAGASVFGGNRSFTLGGGYDTIEIGSITTATNTSTSSLTLGASGNTGTLLLGNGVATAALVKTGLGTLILSNNSTYNGGTNVAEGTLTVLASNALGVSTVPGDSGSGPLAIVPTSLFATVNFQTSSAVSSLTNYINGNASGGVAAIVLGAPTGGGVTLTIGSDGTNTVFSGNISDLTANNSAGSIIKIGTGSLTLSGINNYSGGTTANGGKLIFGSSTAYPANSNLTIATGATAAAGATGGIFALQINTLNNSGLLDLTKNAAIIHSGTSISMASTEVQSGFNGGAWNGTTGITSSSAAADATHLTAVGVIINDTTANGIAGNLSGQALYTSIDGATTQDGDILLKTTYYGDANLNGVVDGSDYSLIDNGFINNLTGWYNGDFNYDGVVNGSDYTLIDNAFNSQGASLASAIASPNAIATAQIAGSAAVPEPASIAIVALGSLSLLGTRRRRK
jgi:fibronectin-binding autotransporter adhesin